MSARPLSLKQIPSLLLPIYMTQKNDQNQKTIAIADVRSGMQVKIFQKIKEVNAKGDEKERTQFFAGTVIAKKGGNTSGATITVRKVSEGVGVEKIFPLHAPSITKVELLKTYRVRRNKLYFLRNRSAKLKEKHAILV